MTYGYSQSTVAANKRASNKLLGVALGRLCIANDIPVSLIAERVGVSRQTIYNWFEGKHEPNRSTVLAIEKLIDSLRK
jgi:transcriptional regulator with XRE-family HTH domain